MKAFLVFAVAASLALNAAFAILVFKRRSASPAAQPIVDVSRNSSAAAPKITPEVWTKLNPEDLPALVARLRAAGFPPDILRAILAAQLSESFAARRKALQAGGQTPPFWKNQPRDPQRELALRQLDREQEKALRSLLGADGEFDDPTSRLYENHSLNFLPVEKAVDVRAILRDIDERRSDLYAAGFSPGTDRDKMSALDKERRDRLAQLLTPAELFEYDLRNSQTADNLRTSLEAFQPTEQEFRTLYQLRAPFDERFGQDFGLTLTPDQRRQREDAEKLLNEQIKSTLGPERAAEYERGTDYQYLRTNQLVTRLELPPDTTDKLWNVQKEFEQRRSDIHAASREERVQQLTALQQEAIAKVTPLLGNSRSVDAYKQYGGQWLQNLVPRNAAANAPKN